MAYCIGISGSPAHKVENADDLIADLCDDCQMKLVATNSWSNQASVDEVKQRGGKKGGGKREKSEWRNYAVKLPKAS